ncbi:MAG TPA: hypothetical protein VM165_15225 [Planctomycetaceae bacterium]|nr:hypothetical protein [Planctomycetaceae bacterium]
MLIGHWRAFAVLSLSCLALTAEAGVGDPQLRTDHPWYPGELACSTFERLAATQAEMFERVTGARPRSDQDRALAAWMWRNLHYAHGEQGAENLWGTGFQSGDATTREYWTGLFAHGFGLCGTTHAQWTAELNALLGPGRSRTVGVRGHNACEVWLTGGPYGEGRWALLDHDISTVVFDPDGARLLSIEEIRRSLPSLSHRPVPKERQHGWPLGGLHPDDPQAYAEFNVVEHQPGYAGPPPLIAVRRGESLRRYFQPGLEDGRTFVFWGRNYRAADVPGLERSRTWVNQPEKFRGTPAGSGYHPGQARFGNAVYRYRPSFRDGSYREGVIAESDQEVVFEFQTPFMIGATPPNDSDWGVYEPGGRNGLVVTGQTDVPVAISVDRGAIWHEAGRLPGPLDLTDRAKGHRQYWLKLGRPAVDLADAALEIVTVCQANPALFPRLKDEGATVTFASSGQALVSAGPNRAQAAPHIVEGAFDTPRVTLELGPPRGHPVTRLFAAAHVASSNPPDPEIRYQIEYSHDGGRVWLPLVKDGRIIRRGQEPADFWSQSLWSGGVPIPGGPNGPVRVRFLNDGGKRYLRAEAHLAYAVPRADSCRVTFAWSDDHDARRTAEHTFAPTDSTPWRIDTARNVTMRWVEIAAAP